MRARCPYRLLALVTAASSCIPRGDFKLPVNQSPERRDDGWQVAEPEEVGLDPASVREAYDRVFSEDEFINAVSLLVVRDGVLVAEGYVRDLDDIDRIEHVQSVTKSFTSMAFGIARGMGHFEDLDAPLADFVDVDDPDKRAITLRHLLTMRSGIDVNNDRFNVQLLMRDQEDPIDWLLGRPLFAQPGAEFLYRDCDTQLLAAAIAAEAGRDVEELIADDVFAPLEITTWHWERLSDDSALGPFGLWLRPRDLARVAEMIRNGGVWDERQVVPAEWLAEATSKQDDANELAQRDNRAYGFKFWILTDRDAYSTWGHGGNFMYVVPAERLSVVLTSMPNAGERVGTELRDMRALVDTILEGAR